MSASKLVAHVLWRSRGGIRRHVKTVASKPPCGWTTAGVWGPPELASYFDPVPFTPISRVGLLRPPRDVDVIHAHGVTAGIVALAPKHPPVVLSLHVVVGKSGRTRASPLATMAARRIARRADAIVGVSQEAADAFDGAVVIAPAFEALARPTRDRMTIREELGASDEDVVVVTVSRLESTKRLDLFINGVEASGAVGWIVGDGSQRGGLDALASGSRTTLLGHRDDVADLLAAADVFALPSVSETYGIAVAEAIAAGLPVVATTTGAIGELVGSAGVLVPPDDDDAFVDALVTLVGDEPQRQRRAKAAQSVVRPDAASLTAELGRIYDDVIARRS